MRRLVSFALFLYLPSDSRDLEWSLQPDWMPGTWSLKPVFATYGEKWLWRLFPDFGFEAWCLGVSSGLRCINMPRSQIALRQCAAVTKWRLRSPAEPSCKFWGSSHFLLFSFKRHGFAIRLSNNQSRFRTHASAITRARTRQREAGWPAGVTFELWTAVGELWGNPVCFVVARLLNKTWDGVGTHCWRRTPEAN